ncbi:hypothetical protein HBH56_068630 [Parastagonospora nodorum]|uniref:Pierisin-like domain-containing protein n=1 Tax=Phaeosphaeria nodorum (strain SN15 / ATCC MYA-4574 / FGSC 10173) TaxID=321614 RepID=A0A7U2EUU4_PHANO|nr:hypothetical protein HBH56_068630 [Parastagonospora nodorum]QRC93521.1 hypothetical protein JI435_429330 [Parastagonospora nodorum SN15]KAH3932335.1 hypothetical protein HBH54_079490 [Parastagonospora nodorum]KAH3988342.1 hypothetical protein HBH51_003050 [Parastagonospora nodorum]KAH4071212.1 hypothetical protein HBH50_077900 [Parastagonospora nodorum]
MFGRSQIVHFAALLALLSPALATVYRADSRSPQEILDDGGFKAWNPQGTGSVIDHVKNKLGDQDPWVSTTSSEDFAKSGATYPGNSYVYHISENGIKLVDTKKAFEEAGEVHPNPAEKEFSVKGEITWDSIIKWDVYNNKNKKISDQTRDDFEDGQEDKKRSVPLVRSVKFRV